MLTNITLSAIPFFNLWTTPANVTTRRNVNIYNFTRPLSLVLPYGIALALSLPCLGLGFVALYDNGVPAVDGGFIQLLTTTRGSETVDRLAAGGCLGGEYNVPSLLSHLKLRYGELVDSSGSASKEDGNAGAVMRRAGFGTDEEIRPLCKESMYGASCDGLESAKAEPGSN